MFESFDRTTVSDFEPKKTLNQDFFHNGMLDSRVRLKLMDIADDFIDTLEVRWVKPEDVVLTGSMANYNWTDFSDVDVHVVVDYSKVYKNKKFVKDYFDAKKELWKSEHENLTIFGFPVEMYVEDSEAPAESGGVYSLNKNVWVKEPKEMDVNGIDKVRVKKLAKEYMDKIDDIEERMKKEKDDKKLDNLAEELEDLFAELRDGRKTGLKSGKKELSRENIVWKILRAEGYLEKIWDLVNMNYDRQNSLNETSEIQVSN